MIKELEKLRDIFNEISRISLMIINSKPDNFDNLLKDREDLFLEIDSMRNVSEYLKNYTGNNSNILDLKDEINKLILSITIDTKEIEKNINKELDVIRDKMGKKIPIKRAIGMYKIHNIDYKL